MKIFRKYIFPVIFLLPVISFSQSNADKLLDYALSYRGLTRNDITIPIDFFNAGEKSPTNDSKLILPLVRNMMINPLMSLKWLDTVMEYKELQLIPLVHILFHDIDFYNKDLSFNLETHEIGSDFKIPDYKYPLNIEQLLTLIENRTTLANEHEKNLLKVYSKEDINFLQSNLLSIIEETDKDDPSNFDIFKYNQARDSSMMISKHTMDLLAKLDRNLIYQYSMDDLVFCYGLYEFLIKNKEQFIKQIGKDVIESEVNGKKIAIGGIGNNVYEGDYAFIIDFGGDDVYKIDHTTSQVGSIQIGNNFSCIIDLSGNDYYSSNSNAALGASVFASSFIFDKEGDDTYIGKDISLGSSIGGIGLIYDESGNDTYHGVSYTIGAGCFGVGLVVDRTGNDFYIANSYGEGFGMTQGIGVIVDNKGNDSYLVDARSLDIGRYEDHYVSMVQGYGLGLRPYYAGGIGLLIEGEGNDVYHADIFGQGGAYWYSLGALVDKSGHDHYEAYQYAQGAGIHLAVGLLKDYDGWDFYSSDGVSQGCGHDFGFGLLWDVKGNDNYSAYSLSQGAGNANGIGILIDESGIDGYLVKDPRNTRGYGNPRREYGSIGLLIDGSGEDYYSQAGYDSSIINSSMWGTSLDYYEKDTPEQFSGNTYKVPFDESSPLLKPKDQSPIIYRGEGEMIEKYFIMAKTLEPRFSLWVDYGLKKLVEDSTEAANYVLTKLATDDARETNLMRILSHKIEFSLAASLKRVLDEYLNDKSKMEPAAVSFACYLFGETKDPSAKETLLKLTYDENKKVRSSALNALGKINYNTPPLNFLPKGEGNLNDEDFRNRVSQRLIELINEVDFPSLSGRGRGGVLFYKDLAFACKNYFNPDNPSASLRDALVKLLSFDFFGVRFLAADALKDYWKDNIVIPAYAGGTLWVIQKTAFQAFLMSLTDIKDEVFIKIYDELYNYCSNDEILRMNLLDLLKQREKHSLSLGESKGEVFYREKIKSLQESVSLKVR